MEYQVDLEMFRGPLDLLLYLVKREEVDICDIPIARILEQFQHYLDIMTVIDVERVGDFIVMAGTLMEIKSKMVLPRSAEEAAEDEADPRQELVRQLIEYKKFKDVAALLEAQAERQSLRLARQPLALPSANDPATQPSHPAENRHNVLPHPNSVDVGHRPRATLLKWERRVRPSVVVEAEEYNRLVRLLKRGILVTLRVSTSTGFGGLRPSLDALERPPSGSQSAVEAHGALGP